MMTHGFKRWTVEIALAASLVVAVLWHPILTAAGVVGFFAVALAFRLQSRLPELFLGLLGICLIGYAFMGRGFAYLGYPPLYVGEITLAVGVLALLLKGGSTAVFRSPISWLILAFMSVGILTTVPHIGAYGLDTFRDAVIWGYGIFALLVASFLLRTKLIVKAVHFYGRCLPWFLVWIPIVVAARQADVIPVLPGSEVPIIHFKGGDTSVHLAGILVFLVLGFHWLAFSRARSTLWLREWAWYVFWLVCGGLAFAVNRGGMLSVMTASFVALVLRPLSRWGKFAVVCLIIGTAFVAFDIEINVGSSVRTLSAESIFQNLRSIIEDDEVIEGRSGTREWRLSWWTDIINYTVYGEHFWTGKGYGINLANDDGYQVYSNDSLRSPHNGHLTILARSGVPGAVAWVLLQGLFAISLLLAYFRARGAKQDWWAKLNLWILCYWVAFMVNASFDVFLEGPQGGIWFWSLFGFGIAVLEAQRRGYWQVETEVRA